MAEFLKGSTINTRLEDIFESAKSSIIIISPFIKLHSRIKEVLSTKKGNPNVLITMVFGKNEDDITKSLNKEDFEFLSEFPNIEIYHEKRLHAKYYANENSALLSSMNLYDFSQNNNIEFGIFVQPSLIGGISGKSLDREAWDYFEQVIKNSNLLFHQEPQYESVMLGLNRKYVQSKVVIDKMTQIYNLKPKIKSQAPSPKTKKRQTGYCIRTGVEIPFNPERPMSNQAFKTWNQYGDDSYPEKFCHYSGEESNGKTSFSRPILHKNWKDAQKLIDNL